ncbi:MAG: ABC transporter substrate-binding protein [Chloroflexi bacterium]|nr:ABC transporter substrate-binding protein [Chloroflexota bacterium]MBV9131557.1 ABC transporter substrate-binding protein [Chloroflexota bacterium]
MDRGYFAAEGLEVNLVPVKSISDEVTMLVTGGADLGASAPDVSLFNAIAGGVDIRMLASGGVFLPGTRASGLVVRQDLIDQGMYRGPADFRGRRIGVSSVQGQFYAEQILARAGLSASDVNFTTITAPQLLAALQGHAVDAAWLVEPSIGVAAATGVGQLQGTGFDAMPGGVSRLVLATDRVNELTVAHFMRAYLQGLRDFYHAFWLKDADPGPLLESLAVHGPVHDRQILDGVAVHTVDPTGGIDVASLNHYQDYYIATGNQTDAVDMDQHIDLGPLESALGSLGRL